MEMRIQSHEFERAMKIVEPGDVVELVEKNVAVVSTVTIRDKHATDGHPQSFEWIVLRGTG